MARKTVLLIDDEQAYLEALADALEYDGHRVLKATTGEEALSILEKEQVDLATIDIMMPPGASIQKQTSSQETGIYLCELITRRYPNIDLFCLSVVSDPGVIRQIKRMRVQFLRKGETPLRTVLRMIQSRLSGIAYSTERDAR